MKMIGKYSLFLIVALAAQAPAGDVVLSKFRGPKGNYDFRVDATIISKTPNWIAGAESLPFKVEDAIRISTEFLNRRDAKWQYSPWKVQLSSISNPEIGTKWYYVVSMVRVVNGVLEFENTYEMVVLMDGTIIEKTEVI